MASPELLGVSSGAALGLIGVALFFEINRLSVTAGAAGGALLAISAVLALGRRSSFAPDHMLLAGVMLAALLGSASSVIVASGDPRAGLLLTWLAGSTYRATMEDAFATALAAILALASAPLLARQLAILPLGADVSRAVGVPMRGARAALMAAASLATAVATLAVGPLSFVGFMAPHAARIIGLQTAAANLVGAMAIGAGLMVLADWLGRMIAFPWQIPAGLVGAIIGGVYLTYVLSRPDRRRG
ncbi:iron chelate uptake ABC transporter family permease subunit [Methylopila musalis]|uniref:Iron chelate uptake ABC transporter family permease subunit n=1 Tax=Methylopila musalis TaxID=1134781 RepID=A0ABW3Z4X0_9HYPH